jgi:hypothetical protein
MVHWLALQNTEVINTYGLFPAIITPEELACFHGIDERISL